MPETKISGEKRLLWHGKFALTVSVCWFLLALAPASALALSGQLNLNTATAEELQQLPFIGQTKAAAIVDHRRKQGPFKSLDELLTSTLIGESSLAAIRPYLSLSGSHTLSADAPAPKSVASPTRPALQEIRFSRHISLRPGEVKILPDGEYFPTLLQSIGEAKHRITLAMFLFKTSDAPDNRPMQIAQALIAARRRGVQVDVLLEKSGYDEGINRENEKVAALLRKNRISIRFDQPGTTTHTKLAVVDGRLVFVGSHNLTQAALTSNHEFSLLIDSSTLALEVSEYLARITAAE